MSRLTAHPSRRVIGLALAILALPCATMAQRDWMTLSVDRSEASLGESRQVTAEIRIPPSEGQLLGFAEPADDKDAAFEVRLESIRPPLDKLQAGDPATATFETVPWAVGDVVVSLPAMLLLAPSGERREVTADDLGATVTLHVASNLAVGAGEQLPGYRPLRGAVRLPLSPLERALRLLLVALPLSALVALIVYLRRRASRPLPVPVIPPDVWAFRALDALGVRMPETFEQTVAWHFDLGRLVRSYIGRRWAINGEKMTSYEVSRALSATATELTPEWRARLEELLDQADGVKFACEPASKLTCQDRLKTAKAFVKESTALVQAAEAAREAAAAEARAA